MKRFAAKLAIASTCLSGSVAAAPFDGSSPLICAALSRHLCSADAPCEAQDPEDSDVPRFLKVSVKDRQVTGVRPSGAKIDTKIEAIKHATDTMFLQGIQEAFIWSMAISEKDGAMTLTAANDGNGMVIFGACTVP
jgi:hypothetical protein